ncbi:MAG: hypothetical protein II816_04495 [Elusimicrobia bacterium]|nr:hypothetical protein [Elusimicrobiota bacterium]
MKNLKVYQIFLLFILLFITLLIYIPMLDAGYCPTDDWAMLRSYSGALKNISFNYIINTFTHFHEGLYHPLVTLSYSLEIGLFGFIPAIFHFDNILLHLINIWLVFLIFYKLSKKNYWIGFVVAFLFALHPTRVEVVAWISARKDLLYAPFYLLSILFYLKSYNKQFTFSPFHPLTLSVIFFLLSCFSKSMAITLPFILILIDFYMNNFDKKNIKKYIPYFVISLIFIIITFISHYGGNEDVHATLFKTFVNFINAHFNILFYLEKLILPIKLYCLYPYFYDMTKMLPWFIMYSPAVLYLLMFFVFLLLKKYKNKLIFFSFMFFLITIIPVSNIFPIGCFAVADRYTYIPYLGLFFLFAKFIVVLFEKYNKLVKTILVFFCIIIYTINCFLSYNRVIKWKTNNYGAPIKMEYYKFGINKEYLLDSIGIKSKTLDK